MKYTVKSAIQNLNRMYLLVFHSNSEYWFYIAVKRSILILNILSNSYSVTWPKYFQFIRKIYCWEKIESAFHSQIPSTDPCVWIKMSLDNLILKSFKTDKFLLAPLLSPKNSVCIVNKIGRFSKGLSWNISKYNHSL